MSGATGVGGEVAAAYDAAADTWAAGSARVYGALATALAEHGPDVSGGRVVDIGAGTGVLSRALLGRGAREVVAVDLAARMLARADRASRAVVADATALPFAAGSFDLAATAFCFSHLSDPAAGFREARRVARALLSGSFDETWTHPAKAAVDGLLDSIGFSPPDWYVTAKQEARVDNREVLATLARSAGFASVEVTTVVVDTGVSGGRALADWRLGMAQIAPFVAALDADSRAWLRRESAAILDDMPVLVVPMLVLRAS